MCVNFRQAFDLGAPIPPAAKMWPSKAVVDSLIYWESPAHSAIAFGSVMVFFLSIKESTIEFVIT